MGLDLVEMVIRVEDTFEIAIPDDVAVTLTTPRKVADYVVTQVEADDRASCLSQESFYFLRETFVPFLGLPRRDFRPKTQLEQIFPVKNRKYDWERLRRQVGVSALPSLARPMWLTGALTLLTVISFFYSIVILQTNFTATFWPSFFIGLAVAISVGFLCATLTRPFKKHFRLNYRRISDLVEYLILRNPQAFKKERRNWTREQIAFVVRTIIIEETGETDFMEDSDFIKDMHLG